MNPVVDTSQPAAPTVATSRRSISLPRFAPLLIALVLMASSMLLRAPTALYTGVYEQTAFNTQIFRYLGAYSDITSLYFRDRIWTHPVPYFGYPLEYPVGMGVVIWLLSFANGSPMLYLLATGLVMSACGLVTVWLVRRWPGTNVWLLALSPGLVMYTVLNWDLLSIMLTVAALWCFRSNRDVWGSLLLAAAIWTKFFPIVLVPLILLDRLLQGRWRDAWRDGLIIGLSSIAINLPFALQIDGGQLRLRDTWLHFFRFNQSRAREVNLWNLFDGSGITLDQINRYSAILLILGVVVVMVLMIWHTMRAPRYSPQVLLAASLIAIAWFFFVNKIYSPQYSLWLAVFLALLAAPPALAVMFAAVDVGYFVASFITLYLLTRQNLATQWFFSDVLIPSMVVRELAILSLITWAVWRILGAHKTAYTEPTTLFNIHG